MTERAIGNLLHWIEGMDSPDRTLWDRFYEVSRREGHLILPPALQRQEEEIPFLHQSVLRIRNRITGESTLFNELRARRPLLVRQDSAILQEIGSIEDCPFCHPRDRTPSDPFGRVEGRYCLTASNLAKYDALHAVIIFRDHDPFVIEEEPIRDFLQVSHTWCERAHAYDPRACYPFFMWNCLWRAGASIIHGHAQVLLSVEPYRGIRHWIDIQDKYRRRYGASYHEDLIHLYRSLGLAIPCPGGTILAHLTPVKEREVVIFGSDVGDLPPLIAHVLSTYRRLGVRSFNLALYQSALEVPGPVMVRVVDRGDLLSRSSDIGGMELYAGMAVVSSDPFLLADALRAGWG